MLSLVLLAPIGLQTAGNCSLKFDVARRLFDPALRMGTTVRI